MLSAKQKFLMDTYGYIVVPNLVSAELIDKVRQEMDRMDRSLPVVPHDNVTTPHGHTRKIVGTNSFSKFSTCIEFSPAFLEIAMHPTIISYVEDIVGGPVRYEEQECSINRRDPDAKEIGHIRELGWHRGISPDFSCYAGAGRNNYLWVKAIVFLTDIGPDDGGTSVIPGTHRADPEGKIISEIEPWMVHQVQGTAGSVLFFSEALIHSVTPIRSDKTRYIMITGYVPPFMREYGPMEQPSAEFLATLGEKEKTFMTGNTPVVDKRYQFRL